MRTAGQDFCLQQAKSNNQIVLGSECRANCTYCYNKANPADLDLITIPKRSPEELQACIAQLDPNKPDVIIGEFANKKSHKIIHGDIAEYPDFLTIIEQVRHRCPDARINIIASNGSAFTPDNLSYLNEKIKNLSITLHAMTHDRTTAAQIKADHNTAILDYLPMISRWDQIQFAISLVALPHRIEWEQIEQTVAFLIGCRPASLICNLFGYTRFTQPQPGLTEQDNQRIQREYDQFVQRIQARHQQAMTFSPILCDTYLQLSSGKPGAFYKMDAITLQRALAADGKNTTLAFCSEAAYPELSKLVGMAHRARLLPVKNHTFGGNIIAGGLLTIDDFALAINQTPCEVALIPDTPFDEDGLDLKGQHYSHLSERTGRKIVVLKSASNYFLNLKAMAFIQGRL